jgi:selenocysteine-specific elongation factor
MTGVVIATAGHIDHGKTTLLRALTGMDADRLPEERARGMTIDVGYAHLRLDDGSELDFVDVPGHDRLVGNMLVGAGEADAWLLVVAADDGPRAQTLEHLELLDALGLVHGVAVVTKTDAATPERVSEVRIAVAGLLASTRAVDVPILAASAVSGAGVADLAAALVDLRDRVRAASPDDRQEPSPRLALDRVFSVRGRGVVVTGSLRHGPLSAGQAVRILPEGLSARVREVQAHGRRLERSPLAGRVALNLAGVDAPRLRRGQVVVAVEARPATPDPRRPRPARELLVAFQPPAGLRRPLSAPARRGSASAVPFPPPPGLAVRLHLGTNQVDALVARAGPEGGTLPDGRAVARLRLARTVAAAAGDRLVLRLPDPTGLLAGGVVLDPAPPRGPSRRRMTSARLGRLAAAFAPHGEAPTAGAVERRGREQVGPGDALVTAHLGLHGLVPGAPAPSLAADVLDELLAQAEARVRSHQEAHPRELGMPVAALRAALAPSLRRTVTAAQADASAGVDHALALAVGAGRLSRAGEHVHTPGWAPAGLAAEEREAMDRLLRLLDAPAPPPLSEATRAAGCSPEGLRELEAHGELVRLEEDLAWTRSAFDALAAEALRLAREGPLSPARLRDATGTSRKYVMAVLEELARRGVLRRTPEGHLPGPRAPSGARVGH